ncbi:uncharacterized protein [Physcomitrium patens]
MYTQKAWKKSNITDSACSVNHETSLVIMAPPLDLWPVTKPRQNAMAIHFLALLCKLLQRLTRVVSCNFEIDNVEKWPILESPAKPSESYSNYFGTRFALYYQCPWTSELRSKIRLWISYLRALRYVHEQSVQEGTRCVKSLRCRNILLLS